MARLTPSQWLVLDVLAARWRLGEETWNFPKALDQQIRLLINSGYVQAHDHGLSGIITLSLTDKGKKKFLSEQYVGESKWSDTDLYRAWRKHEGIASQEGTMFEDRKVACKGCGHPYEHSPFDGWEAAKLKEEQRQHIADVLLDMVQEQIS